MNFAVTAPADPPPDKESIPSSSFWPAIKPAEIREAQRIDSTVAERRLYMAIVESMASVNDQLSAWRLQQIALGHASLADVTADKIDEISVLEHRYARAVGCLAKAQIIERYRDFDSTAHGDRKADALDPQIDELRRDAAWAISDIRGVGRTTVELI